MNLSRLTTELSVGDTPLCLYGAVNDRTVLVNPNLGGITSSLFAFLAARVFDTLESAQRALCVPFRVVEPQANASVIYGELYAMYRALYFGLGEPNAEAVSMGGVLPSLRRIAASTR